ncbi:vacuolar sorting protein 9 (VPS9) domain containing protein [Fragilaria crotonensis]|nr:vacuolar sorting protein 9 (VPS9) domain containing protein [Fragilaria crotonensis]
MVEQDPADDADKICSLEYTIDTMEETQLCFHPVHHHSFARVSFLISGSVRLCGGCDKRLHSILGYESDSSSQLVRCLACGVYAHRTCALATHDNEGHMWKEKCTVNSKRIQDQPEREHDSSESTNAGGARPMKLLRYLRRKSSTPDVIRESVDDVVIESQPPFPPSKPATQNELNEDTSMVWTTDGPPSHWAHKVEFIGLGEGSDETLPLPRRSPSPPLSPSPPRSPSPPPNVANEEESYKADEQVEESDSSFSSVARAIQENVLVHFRARPTIQDADAEPKPESGDDNSTETVMLLQMTKMLLCTESIQEETLAETKDRLSLRQTKESTQLPKETRDAL